MKALAKKQDLQWLRLWILLNILDLVLTYKFVGAAGIEGNWFLGQVMNINFGLMCFVKLFLAGLIAWVLIRTAKGRLLKPLSIALGIIVVWNLGVGIIFS